MEFLAWTNSRPHSCSGLRNSIEAYRATCHCGAGSVPSHCSVWSARLHDQNHIPLQLEHDIDLIRPSRLWREVKQVLRSLKGV